MNHAAALKARTVDIDAVGLSADRTILRRHPGEAGSWIWHPDLAPRQTAVLRFGLRFDLSKAASPLIHVTADQRYQLRCDGVELSYGPDRCDVEHWAARSFEVDLLPGVHDLEALVWWFSDEAYEPAHWFAGQGIELRPPMAQMSWHGGFLLLAEGLAAPTLDTGVAPWTVQDLTPAVSFSRPRLPGYHDIGPSFAFDLARWRSVAMPARTVVGPLMANDNGIHRRGWSLVASRLPEQQRVRWAGGRIRAVREDLADVPFADTAGERTPWQDVLAGTPLTVPAHSSVSVLWDFEEYRCGYPMLTLQGRGATVEIEWAEALYEADSPDAVDEATPKGDRSAVDGKVFVGVGDRWTTGDTADKPEELPSLWWRSGRYLRLRVAAGEESATIVRLGLLVSGYPLSWDGLFESSDPSFDELLPLFERTYRAAAHETWIDSPYYEQLCYVGDTLLHCRSSYAWSRDDRLCRRALEMFDWSRRETGLVAERYPSAVRQESATYALLFPLMVRDFAWWRNDKPFVLTLLPGLRSLQAEIEALAGGGLLTTVPGWPFVDWVPGWPEGCGPGVREGDSSIVNLHFVLALQALADVEHAVGDERLSQRCTSLAADVFAAVVERYFDPRRGLLLDTPGCDQASEHAQMYALLTGLLGPERSERCLINLREELSLARATIYASHYLLDAFYRAGEAELFHRRLNFWRELPARGFCTTPEAPEPSRSDCHAWGAHPAWHTLASIAGVRPAAPGFRRVRVAPLPGGLLSFAASVVHPNGEVAMSFRRHRGEGRYRITLPAGVNGEFVDGEEHFGLEEGPNDVVVTLRASR